MADYSELVKRLRGVNWICHIYGKTEVLHDTVCHEAADAIEALVGDMPASRAQQKLIEQNARIVELQNALAECLRIIEDWNIEGFNIEKSIIRNARKVLGEKE
jgi:hypothetical protein